MYLPFLRFIFLFLLLLLAHNFLEGAAGSTRDDRPMSNGDFSSGTHLFISVTEYFCMPDDYNWNNNINIFFVQLNISQINFF